jgi:hypothetical protein
MRGMGDNGNGATYGKKGPVVHFPMGRDWEDTRLLTGETFPPLTTLEPRDVTQYPNYSYLRMNQWDGQYQPNTTEGARWSPAYKQFAGMGAMSTRGLLSSSKRRTFGGMGATGVPGPPYSKAIFSDKGNRFTRIVGDTQFPLFHESKAYRLAGMGGMGESLLDTLTGGKVTEVQNQIGNVALLLKVSTAAAVLSALVTLAKR